MQAAARFEPERDVRFSTPPCGSRSGHAGLHPAQLVGGANRDHGKGKSLFFSLRRLRANIDDGRYVSL